ncbi:uncharacterized protein [Chlorocebus sabaeus]|uniref:uncharacterized protein n=1 Tax=Chlorocebus sabaeus TaxID=60711 RepID=UPI00045E0581
MNGFSARSSGGRRLGGALGSAPGAVVRCGSEPGPLPPLSHAHTRSLTPARTPRPHRPGLRVRAASPSQPPPRTSRTPARRSGREEGAGAAPDVTARRPRCAGVGRPPLLHPGHRRQRPPSHPLAVPQPAPRDPSEAFVPPTRPLPGILARSLAISAGIAAPGVCPGRQSCAAPQSHMMGVSLRTQRCPSVAFRFNYACKMALEP